MRLLVTGGSGLLGGNLALLAAHNHQVCATFHRHPVQIAGATMIGLDLCEAETVAREVDRLRPDLVVHCAAMTSVDACQREPAEAYRHNVEATSNVARAAARAGARLVYISTDYVFDGDRSYYRESDPPNPINHYGQSKLEGEAAALRAGGDALIVRTSIYGWNVRPKQCFAEWVIASLSVGQRVKAFTDQYSTPMLVNNLAAAILEAAGRGLNGTYHIAGSERCSRYELARAAARIFDLDADLIDPASTAAVPLLARRPRDCSLDVRRAQSQLRVGLLGLTGGLMEMRRLRDHGQMPSLQGVA